MSNKREPLLSDEAVIDQTWVPELDGKNPYLAYEAGINSAKRYYERLITEGKLRVVDEVDNFMLPYPIAKEVFGCSNCQTVFDRRTTHSKHGRIKVIKFCPGCGNSITKL
jgi:hypothetical protein